MPFINLKLWIYGGIAVALFGLILRFDYLSEQNKILTADNEQYIKNAESAARQVKLADEARNDYLNKLEVAQNEIDDLRGRVESGSIKLLVKATCPKLPAVATDTAGIITAAPELTEDARRYYFDHRRDEIKLNSLLDLCIKTLQDDRK